MTPIYLEWIKIAASVLTPLALLVLGLKINRTLEQGKIQIAKDKEWKSEWARRFYAQAISYNDAVVDAVMALYSIQQESNEKITGWEKRLEDLQVNIHEIARRVQKTQWSLVTMCEFCPNTKRDVLSTAELTFKQLAELLEKKQGSLETIRNSLHLFNIATMKAHGEILGLT